MDYKADIKYLRVGVRKMREVADVVRDKMVNEALVDLNYLNKRAAPYLAKSLRSAVAGAKNAHSANEDLLVIKLLEINEGPDFKRWRPVSRGMSHPYARKTCHVRIILSDAKKADSLVKESNKKPETDEKEDKSEKSRSNKRRSSSAGKQ